MGGWEVKRVGNLLWVVTESLLEIASLRGLRALRVPGRRIFRATAFDGDDVALRFAIDVCNRHRPERNQIDSGHELGKERWQEFPVPAEKVSQYATHGEIDNVIGGRCGARDEDGKNKDLKHIRENRQGHCGLHAPARRDCDFVVSHGNLLLSDSRLFRQYLIRQS